MELTLDDARQALAAQPFSILVGARMAAFGGGGATLEIDIRDQLTQQNGYLHGGVLSYAADNAITFAAGSVLGPHVLTGGFAIDYLRPATGTLLVAKAVVTRSTPRQASARCDLTTVDTRGTSTVVATAQGTVAVTRGA